MENEEKTLALIDTLDNYSFYITNNRLFAVLKKNSWKNKLESVPLTAAFGIVGAAISYGNNERRKNELKGISIPFDEIEFISLCKSRNGGELNIKAKKFWKFLKVDKDQFTKVSELLPKISQLNGKLRMH